MSGAAPGRPPQVADLAEIASRGGGGPGVRWHLPPDGDLNANLVSFPAGGGVGEHRNELLDVLVVGVAGSGEIVVDGTAHPLGPARVVLVPRGASRATRAGAEGLSYLTVHRRRTPGLTLGAGARGGGDDAGQATSEQHR